MCGDIKQNQRILYSYGGLYLICNPLLLTGYVWLRRDFIVVWSEEQRIYLQWLVVPRRVGRVIINYIGITIIFTIGIKSRRSQSFWIFRDQLSESEGGGLFFFGSIIHSLTWRRRVVVNDDQLRSSMCSSSKLILPFRLNTF